MCDQVCHWHLVITRVPLVNHLQRVLSLAPLLFTEELLPRLYDEKGTPIAARVKHFTECQ